MEFVTDSTSKEFRGAVIHGQSGYTGGASSRKGGPLGVSGDASAATVPIRSTIVSDDVAGVDLASSMRNEVATHKRLVTVGFSHKSLSLAFRSYLDYLNILLSNAPQSGRPPLSMLASLMSARMHLLANVDVFDEWLDLATAVYPDAESIPVPDRFVTQSELPVETYPDRDCMRILDAVRVFTETL